MFFEVCGQTLQQKTIHPKHVPCAIATSRIFENNEISERKKANGPFGKKQNKCKTNAKTLRKKSKNKATKKERQV